MRKSFTGSPYSRPPATPKQIARSDDTVPGSILKTLFSPANWFGRSAPAQEEESSESSASDEENSVGMTSSDQQSRQIYPTLPETPVNRISSPSGSPNALLASFFAARGDAPLSAIEKEGVLALLSKQTEPTPAPLPSYATPMRKAYQPIFTPVRTPAPTAAATEVRRRPGYPTTVPNASPFRHRTPKTGFRARDATPKKYALDDKLTVTEKEGKRPLDELPVPLAKRAKPDEPVQVSRTAASMLEILNSDAEPAPAEDDIKTMLNPYASASSKIATPRKTPAKKAPRSAIEEITRVEAIEKRLPYQPKKSSNLANSFTVSDVSLFSPKRRVDQAEHNKHGGFIPEVAEGMFERKETHSTTPKFSFSASQEQALEKDESSNSDKQEDGSAVQALFGKDKEHKAHGGSVQSSSFGFGLMNESTNDSNDKNITNDENKHKANGGFSFTPVQVKSAPVIAEDDTAISEPVIHQLRDGTEYVSPSKSRKPEPKSTGFVFNPSHSKTPSAFTFENITESKPAPGGFTFDASKPSSGTFDASKPTSGFTFDASKPSSGSTVGSKEVDKTIPSTKERVLSLDDSALQQFTFTKNTLTPPDATRQKVMNATLLEYKFTVPAGLNWKKPESWTCDTCMITNKPDAKVCAACETEKPGEPVQPAPTTTGFNWAAAGLAKPSGWTCSTCMCSNPADKTACLACETEKA